MKKFLWTFSQYYLLGLVHKTLPELFNGDFSPAVPYMGKCLGSNSGQRMWPGVPVRQPYAGVDFIPQSGIYKFGYWRLRVTFTCDVPVPGS
jgi:hypothetical protein